MADKNIQIKNLAGDLLFPKTLGSVVFNNNGENLGAVEAGAQVNIIEKITINGQELAIDASTKTASFTLPAADEYTIVKLDEADEGMSATYQLAKNGEAFGTKINILKDMVISGGELKNAVEADVPVAGLAVGDPYLELTIANNDGTKIYIPVKDLVDIYTADEIYINLKNGKFELNYTALETKLQDTFYTEAEIDAKLEAADGALADAVEALNKTVGDMDTAYKAADTEINGRIDALDAAYKAADETINGRIDDLDAAYKAADEQLGKDLAAQVQALEAKDEEILGQITAKDETAVHIEGAETINGVKTFANGLLNGATIAADDDSTQVATTAWVNAAIAAAVADLITYDVLA